MLPSTPRACRCKLARRNRSSREFRHAVRVALLRARKRAAAMAHAPGCSRWQQSAMPRWAWRAWAWVLEGGSDKEPLAFKGDLPCIKCDVCEIVASEVFREVEKQRDAAPMTVKNTKPGAPKVQVSSFSEADVSAVLRRCV